MANWSELPIRTKMLVLIGVPVALTVAMYFLVYKSISDTNDKTKASLTAVKAENDSLRPYENKLNDLESQIGNLRQQLEQMKQIVPDEKDADQFIRMVQVTAASAGIEVRSYNSKATTSKEFFVEAPFDIEIDGPYYGVLAFFDKMAKLERIVNVSNLAMASIDKPGASKVRRKYAYAPGETVVASCTATTYFSREAPAGPAAKPGTPAQK